MPQVKSKSTVGLGNSLMNDRFGKGKGSDRRRAAAITRTNHATGEQYLTNERKEASWVKMRSVTQQGALDEFLATAELADTDFTAEKMSSVKIIHTDQKNPYLLSSAEERIARGKHREHKSRLTVPRRPKWDDSTTPEELDTLERESFLNWRRGLAELQENNDLLMTPFERNLEVWRQLWRVIERSDLVVQIVDARNPLLFRSEDLELYVKDVDPKKENLLLINKADMMTVKQRKAWAAYLKDAGISYNFFSATLAKEMNEAGENSEDLSEDDNDDGNDDDEESLGEQTSRNSSIDSSGVVDEEDRDGYSPKNKGNVSIHDCNHANATTVEDDEDIRILTVAELEAIFLQYAPRGAADPDSPGQKMQVGLVGYPNVGKSSTINALIGAKKVSVSSTPGKTKHFQTIHLSNHVILCDCPGLVFPNFATTKADLVCNGILPIDQLREYTGPVTLVAKRIPRPFLEAIYGIHMHLQPLEEGGSGVPTAEEILSTYAKARGFTTQGMGQPDESRAARYVLKDYVNGKLLYCEPPPGDHDAADFNRELYDESHLPPKRRAALAAALDMSLMSLDNEATPTLSSDKKSGAAGTKSGRLDAGFFGPGEGNAAHLSQPFHHKFSEQGMQGVKELTGRKARTMIALENGLDPKDVQIATSSKKHFKGGSKGKQRGVNLGG